jgi:hypothetical protein
VFTQSSPGPNDAELMHFQSWTPLPLRMGFWLCYATILIAGAIALEVALYYNKKHNGKCSCMIEYSSLI